METINYEDIADAEKRKRADDEAAGEETSPTPAPKLKKRKKEKTSGETRFKWSSEMVAALVTKLLEFKREQSDEGNDFESDLVKLYSELRIGMTSEFDESFGPAVVLYQNTDDMNKEEALKYKKQCKAQEDLKSKGYVRIKAKVKELRQNYKQAVDSGSRSGSGKSVERCVEKHWAQFEEIWGGSPATTALLGGICSFDRPSTSTPTFEEERDHEVPGDDDGDGNSGDGDFDGDDDLLFDKQNFDKPVRVKTAACKDVAEKNRNMKKKLSAQQRDMLYYQLAKKEQEQKCKQVEMLRESIEQSNKAMENMTGALAEIGKGIGDGLAALARSFKPPSRSPSPQPLRVPSPPPEDMSLWSQYMRDVEKSFSLW